MGRFDRALVALNSGFRPAYAGDRTDSRGSLDMFLHALEGAQQIGRGEDVAQPVVLDLSPRASFSYNREGVHRSPMTLPTCRVRPWQRLRRALVARFVSLLTQPLKNYAFRFPNDLNALRSQIRKGDVLLVEGSQRVSEAIKYLTQSSWSHAALYIGDEVIRRGHPLADRARSDLGDEAEYVLVEALAADGVVMSPLSKYVEYNIRLCRPHNLQSGDLRVILDEVIGQIGYTYDLKNIFDLARYFLPVSLVPRRFRRRALQFGSGLPTQVICSSMIAAAFAKVGFPILPSVESDPGLGQTTQPLYRRLFSRGAGHPVFRRRHPTLITPRDFDLSSYFDTVKFNVIGSRRFDYRNIIWAEDARATNAGTAAEQATPTGSVQTPQQDGTNGDASALPSGHGSQSVS